MQRQTDGKYRKIVEVNRDEDNYINKDRDILSQKEKNRRR